MVSVAGSPVPPRKVFVALDVGRYDEVWVWVPRFFSALRAGGPALAEDVLSCMFEVMKFWRHGENSGSSFEEGPSIKRPGADVIERKFDLEFTPKRGENSELFFSMVCDVVRGARGEVNERTPVSYPGWEAPDFETLLAKIEAFDPEVCELAREEVGEQLERRAA